MKSILTVCILLMLHGIAYSQDTLCINEYRKLREGQIINKFASPWIRAKQAQFDTVNSLIRSCKGEEEAWDIIYKAKWNSFKIFAEDRLNARNPNKGDIEKVNDRWHTLQNDLRTYEDIIFYDSYIRNKVKDIKVDQETNERNRTEAFTETQKKVDDVVSSVGTVRGEVVKVDNSVKEVQGSVKTATERVDAVQKTTTQISDFLLKRDININNILSFSGFGNDIYGIGFLYVVDPAKKRTSPLTVMAELAFPLDSRGYSGGFFAAAGVQHRSLAMLVGPGVLDEQLGWKGNLIYFPPNSVAGFGVSYSPLTDWGVTLSVNPYYLKKR